MWINKTESNQVYVILKMRIVLLSAFHGYIRTRTIILFSSPTRWVYELKLNHYIRYVQFKNSNLLSFLNDTCLLFALRRTIFFNNMTANTYYILTDFFFFVFKSVLQSFKGRKWLPRQVLLNSKNLYLKIFKKVLHVKIWKRIKNEIRN